MVREFHLRGLSLSELKKLSIEDFAKLIPARSRRSLLRGFTPAQKALIKKIRAGKTKLKTQATDMVIIPEMVDKVIGIHNGKEFVAVKILPEMLGHRLGEFVLRRKPVKHSAPGVGATKSSAFLSVR